MNYQEILGEKANRHLEALIKRLTKKHGLTKAEREDLAQSMVRKLLERAHEYDEASCSRDTWLCSLLTWAVARCMKEVLGSENARDHEDLDALEEDETPVDLHTGPRRPGNPVEEREVKRITVQNFIRGMNPEYREICLRLAVGEKPTEVARAMKLTRKAWRVRMAKLKELALETGLNPSHLALASETEDGPSELKSGFEALRGAKKLAL